MVDLKDPEHITLIFSILGGLGTFLSLLWVKLIKPIIKLLQNQEQVTKTLDTIKKELTTNGGNSLKDTIIDLKKTCNRIEIRQKVMEQRTKASLHYNNIALFETDDHGRLIWTNNSFYELTSNSIDSVDGYDWLTYIDEDDREDFFIEFKSCINMNRKFVKITKNCEGKNIKLVGFPYKINDEKHGGFLVSISEIKETNND
jgi:PAS domain-containing protein